MPVCNPLDLSVPKGFPMPDSPKRPLTFDSVVVYGLFLIPATLLLLLMWWRSLNWETIIDVPLFLYTGFLMDHYGMVPVRDFFAYNMLGTHVVFRWLYHFFGASNLGMRLADSAVLVAVLPLMMRMLAPFGKRVAWGAAVVFGLLHLRYGGLCYLQRDFLALPPITLMIVSATVWFAHMPRVRWLVSGLFCGVLLTIKPHLLLGGLAVLAFLVLDRKAGDRPSVSAWMQRGLRVSFYFALGASLPVLWMIGYYAYYGVLGEFVRIVTDFFPLHADINGDREVFGAGDRLPYTLYWILSVNPYGDFQLAMGAIGGIVLFVLLPSFDQQERRLGYLLLALTVAYFVYPCFAGRFYDHHFYPFRYLSCVWLGLCLRKWPFQTPRRAWVFSRAVAAYCVVSLLYCDFALAGKPPESLPSSIAPPYRTRRISEWLERRLQPGDTVQAIEWGFCGITHAMLQNQARTATGIIWAEGLFHHVSDPYVQELRKRFLHDLAKARPRFVIRSKMDWDYMIGRDCSQAFSELDEFLNRDYFVALDSRDFRIWESSTSPTAQADGESRVSR